MRRFKPSLESVRSLIVTYATLALAAFLPTRNARRVLNGLAPTPSGSERRFRDPWKVRGVIALPVALVVAAGATAFAAGAGTPTGQGPVATGTEVSKAAPSTAAPSTSAPATTLPMAEAAAPVTPPTTAAPAPPPTTAAPVTAPPPAPVVPTQVSGACGGSLPPCCVMMRESGGNPTVVNRSSGASGKWQFMTSTWAGYGGYPTAAAAPESVQDERAAQLWAGGAGAGHWGGGC